MGTPHEENCCVGLRRPHKWKRRARNAGVAEIAPESFCNGMFAASGNVEVSHTLQQDLKKNRRSNFSFYHTKNTRRSYIYIVEGSWLFFVGRSSTMRHGFLYGTCALPCRFTHSESHPLTAQVFAARGNVEVRHLLQQDF